MYVTEYCISALKILTVHFYLFQLPNPQEIGFLTPKPVVYAANIPPEAVPQEDLEGVKKDVANNGVESPAAIAKVARAHADKVIGINRDYGVPAVVSCLTTLEGQGSLGATVRL